MKRLFRLLFPSSRAHHNESWAEPPGNVAEFIANNTEVSTEHLTPEIQLRLLTDTCPLRRGKGENCGISDPYWAFYWPGGQALTRHLQSTADILINRFLLDNRYYTAGKKVLDIGSGCGASAIASKLAGAEFVTANDTDPVALAAVKINAALNNVVVDTKVNNLIGHTDQKWDVILLGDMFYDSVWSADILFWLSRLPQNMLVFIGDPGRYYLQQPAATALLEKMAEYKLPPKCRLENSGYTVGTVWKYKKEAA